MSVDFSESRRAHERWLGEGCYLVELLNTPDDPALSIARARVPPLATTRLHRLRATAERYIIVSGEGIVQIEGSEPRRVGVGDVVVIAPGCAQRIRNALDADLVFLAICTPRYVAQNYEELESAAPAPTGARKHE